MLAKARKCNSKSDEDFILPISHFFSYSYCSQATFFITFVAMENAQRVFIVVNTRHRNERNIIKDLLRCKRWPPTKQLHTHILSISARCIFQFVELNAYIVPKWDGPCKVYAEMAKYELKLSQPVEPYLHWCLWIVALRSRAVGWSENPGGVAISNVVGIICPPTWLR